VFFTTTPSGTISAEVTTVRNLGCSAADFAGFPAGNIALVLRGICPFADKEKLAAEHGASAIIIYNSAGSLFNGALPNPTIPSFVMSHWLGKFLSLQDYVLLSVSVTTSSKVVWTTNIIAETRAGNPNSVIVVGSHLDSVPAGAGINDNGSGSATNLELALATDKCLKSPRNKIRFAWWAAEELGLLGSRFYVANLSPEQRGAIALNLNFDMLASPNYFFGIYNGSSAPEPIRRTSERIQKEFEQFFQAQSLPFLLTAFDGRSDYGPFIEVGIPAGGLATGAEGVKNAAQRNLFGGIANAWYDPCYHAYCDDIGNIATNALRVNLVGAAVVLEFFATNPVLPKSHIHHTKFLPYETHPLSFSIF